MSLFKFPLNNDDEQKSNRQVPARSSTTNSVRRCLAVSFSVLTENPRRCSVRLLLTVSLRDLTTCSRNIAHVLKVVWNNPVHRNALKLEAQYVLRCTTVPCFTQDSQERRQICPFRELDDQRRHVPHE